MENGNSGASVDNGIPKMDFRRREIKDWRNAEGYQAKGLKVRE